MFASLVKCESEKADRKGKEYELKRVRKNREGERERDLLYLDGGRMISKSNEVLYEETDRQTDRQTDTGRESW